MLPAVAAVAAAAGGDGDVAAADGGACHVAGVAAAAAAFGASAAAVGIHVAASSRMEALHAAAGGDRTMKRAAVEVVAVEAVADYHSPVDRNLVAADGDALN